MRIVPDTNVLISAAFWNGSSNEIIKKAENKEIELILSAPIIEEFTEVLSYEEIQSKIKSKNLEMKMTAEHLINISKIVEPSEIIDVVKEDPDDNKFIEAAMEGKADYIITQDNHLLKLKKYKNIKIITPKDFLELFKEKTLS